MKRWIPAKAFEISGGYWQACTLQTAVKLGVFEAIDNRHLESQALASKLCADRRATEMFLNTLVAMGLLRKRKGKFSNTLFSRNFLSPKSPRYIGHIIMHHHHLIDSWSRLDYSIKRGKPIRKRHSYMGNKELRESFLMGMLNIAMNVAPKLAEAIDLSGRRYLFDIGGGPGTYSVYFCLKNPSLRAVVFDLPTTRPFAEKIIKKFRLTNRIKFISGDYLKSRFKGRYDVAFLSHILHAEGPLTCQRLIKKAVSVLEPGGMVIVQEFILDNTMDGPLFPALFSLNMLLGTKQGQAYSEKQIMDMLAKAGVKKIQRLPFRGVNDSGIITGLIE
jgi:predicted O-methyltransferase YrrM